VRPRFKAGSLTGFTSDKAVSPTTTWYVFDRSYAHRVVGTFDGPRGAQRAQAFAAKLNDCPELLQQLLAGDLSLSPRRQSGVRLQG